MSTLKDYYLNEDRGRISAEQIKEDKKEIGDISDYLRKDFKEELKNLENNVKEAAKSKDRTLIEGCRSKIWTLKITLTKKEYGVHGMVDKYYARIDRVNQLIPEAEYINQFEKERHYKEEKEGYAGILNLSADVIKDILSNKVVLNVLSSKINRLKTEENPVPNANIKKIIKK